jgi:hypothetical protein
VYLILLYIRHQCFFLYYNSNNNYLK